MKGNSEVLAVLQEALTAELTASNQYLIAGKKAAGWGFGRLAEEYAEESLDERRHAEALIERILLLEGAPDVEHLFSVDVRDDPIAQFRANYEMEKAAVDRYRSAVVVCEQQEEAGSRVLLERLLTDEERHVGEAETELDNLERLGERLWLAKWV